MEQLIDLKDFSALADQCHDRQHETDFEKLEPFFNKRLFLPILWPRGWQQKEACLTMRPPTNSAEQWKHLFIRNELGLEFS